MIIYDCYNCPVCFDRFNGYDDRGTKCEQCGEIVCPNCIDVTGTSDICDNCADEMSETRKGVTEQELADKWIEEMKACEYTYDDMLRVFDIARQKYRRMLEKEAV